MRRLRPKLTYANVVATVAVFIALGGASYAASKLPKNSVGAKQLKNGSITASKLSAGAKKALKGSIGPTGAQGPKGDPGIPATKLWALLGADGDLVRGSGVVSSGHPGEGKFAVVFNQNVRGCAYLANAGTDTPDDGVSGWPTPGGTSVGPLKDPNGVLITRVNSDGNYTDDHVYVAVFC